MHLQSLSLVVPTRNDSKILADFVKDVDETCSSLGISYEVICVDNGSTDNTAEVAQNLGFVYKVSYHPKTANHSKATRIIDGIWHAQYPIIAVIDAPSTYSTLTITDMAYKVASGKVDILVAKRNKKTDTASYLYGKLHPDTTIDMRSGLRVFKRQIAERLFPHISSTSFDLEFLVRARDAGYKIENHEVAFDGEHQKHHHDPFWRLWWADFKLGTTRSKIIPFLPDEAVKKGQGFHYKGQEFIHHSDLTPHQSAVHRLSGMQMFVILALLTELVIFFIINWHAALVLLVAALTTLYFADLLFNLYLIYRSFSKPAEVDISHSEIETVKEWPRYTILCPLYKEWQVVPQFVTAMSKLDYPKDKLQVMLLLEEDDKETIKEVGNYDLPKYFQTVIVPDSKPKTKPKASNYGLKHATGEYIVIYDAEDVPDPLQLKKAILAFEKAGPRIICIQAKLNFYNPHQNLLTRVFTAEYSLWFDLVLTGLQSIHAPIPLGGTSNHFKKVDLIKMKGWDSFNVTEDCDLGMRLVKAGYQTAVINSTTLEEANSNLKNWFAQRSRWIKGYIQTYLIHMRNPWEFAKTWREPHAVTFQLVVGGKVLSMFINPLMWVITIMYFLFRANIGTFIESFFPAPVLYMGVISLLLGNFLYVYYYMIGCAKHGHHELVKYGVFIPLYWLAMSMAAWMAVYKLIVAPHHWSKTKHGLHLDNKKAVKQATAAIGRDMVDEDLTHVSVRPALT